jgi:hypothetical protein
MNLVNQREYVTYQKFTEQMGNSQADAVSRYVQSNRKQSKRLATFSSYSLIMKPHFETHARVIWPFFTRVHNHVSLVQELSIPSQSPAEEVAATLAAGMLSNKTAEARSETSMVELVMVVAVAEDVGTSG